MVADLSSIGINATKAPRGNTPGPLSFPWRAGAIEKAERRSALTRLEIALIIVVTAIVFTLPYVAYRTYRVRSEVSDGIALARTIAPLIAETIRRGDGVPRELAAAIPVAFEKALTTSAVESVAIIDGRIDVIFGEAANSAIAGQRVSLTPYETADRELVWICGNDVPGPGLNPLGFARGGTQPAQIPSTIDARYLPVDCR